MNAIKIKCLFFHYSRRENVENKTTKTPCHKKIKIKRSCYVLGLFFIVSLTAVTIGPSSSQRAWTFQARHLKAVDIIKKKLNSQASGTRL